VNAVEVSGLNAWFGSNHVLHDVDMEARERTVTAMIGPSGCGKSTLIRCLNRMHEEVSGARVTGKVLWNGQDIYASDSDPVEVRRRIGMVFQRANPFPTMSVLENAVAGLKLGSKLSKSELRERGERALQRAGLWNEVKDRLAAPGGRLSGGQQQRLCIARALAVEPDVLLMDEPASALDPASTLRIEELVEELKESVTVVIVTHNMQQAGRIADWTMFLLNGEVVEAGPTERIFTTPTDQRTEDYVTGRFG
jgi:phosphate transport system ATP-binding protein